MRRALTAAVVILGFQLLATSCAPAAADQTFLNYHEQLDLVLDELRQIRVLLEKGACR